MEAKFAIGRTIRHLRFDYRGVIYDVDPVFMGSDEWYEQVARSRPPKDKPWYKVLVDQGTHETYVAERHLEADSSGETIAHPAVGHLFEGFEGGVYRPRVRVN